MLFIYIVNTKFHIKYIYIYIIDVFVSVIALLKEFVDAILDTTGRYN